ncbi:tetratricopeptide repeat protein [Spirochaeta cellobiosiphila]|uniref:tetratricopeptide repeat protein n=1 Tax=Spirochaeta cellobiosiphila TaxID=504483 RepID=UPI00041E2BC6|nr:tetratricopeptide repeat protein [Spirochaeta cellobiosiphila]
MSLDLDEGIRLYREGHYEQALKVFDALNEEEFPSLPYYLGLACTKLKEYEKALEYFEQVISQDFDLVYTYQSRMVKALIYTELEEYPLAVKELDSIREEGYESPMVFSALGHIYWQMGNMTGALTTLQKALAQDPNNTTALNSTAYILAEKGMYLDKAFQFCLKAIKEQPGNPAYLDSLGWIYHQKKDSIKAEEFIGKALKLAPDNPVIQDHYKIVKKAKGRIK